MPNGSWAWSNRPKPSGRRCTGGNGSAGQRRTNAHRAGVGDGAADHSAAREHERPGGAAASIVDESAGSGEDGAAAFSGESGAGADEQHTGAGCRSSGSDEPDGFASSERRATGGSGSGPGAPTGQPSGPSGSAACRSREEDGREEGREADGEGREEALTYTLVLVAGGAASRSGRFV